MVQKRHNTEVTLGKERIVKKEWEGEAKEERFSSSFGHSFFPELFFCSNSFSEGTDSVPEKREEEDMKRSLVTTSVQSSVFNGEKGWREYRCSTGIVSRSKDWKGLTEEGLF